MGEVQVGTDVFRAGRFPQVCVVTGQPATTQERREAKSPVGALWLLLLFGVLPFVVVRLLSVKRADGILPYDRAGAESQESFKQAHKRQTIWGLALWGIALVVFLVAMSWYEPDLTYHLPMYTFASGSALAGLVVLVRASRSPIQRVRVSLSPAGEVVTISNAHDAFCQATLQFLAGSAASVSAAPQTQPYAQHQAGPGAGWFVDPAGRHEWRYWDGTRWSGQVYSSSMGLSHDPV